jgi:hypothetical protein
VADAVSRIASGSSSGLPQMRRVQHYSAQRLPKAVRRGRRSRQPPSVSVQVPVPVPPPMQEAVF